MNELLIIFFLLFAFALLKLGKVIAQTHRDHESFKRDREEWKTQLLCLLTSGVPDGEKGRGYLLAELGIALSRFRTYSVPDALLAPLLSELEREGRIYHKREIATRYSRSVMCIRYYAK